MKNYTHSIKYSYLWENFFPNKMQSRATCAVGWTWRPMMLLCGSLFVGLKWMQWIRLPSLTFGETCETKGPLRSIDSFFFFFWLQIKIVFGSYKICFQNITWHFGFEVGRQMKFVKHTLSMQASSSRQARIKLKHVWHYRWWLGVCRPNLVIMVYIRCHVINDTSSS